MFKASVVLQQYMSAIIQY